MRLGALILAGGHSIRMGRPKELLPFGDSTLLARICTTLRDCAAPVVVVARDASQPLPTLPPAVERLHDERRAAGPLAALVLGLRHLVQNHRFAAGDAAVLTACDLPFLSAGFVRGLAELLPGHCLVMPRADGFLHPLAAVYDVAVLAVAEARLADGAGTPRVLAERADARFVDGDDLARIDPERRCLRNLNTPADYARALAESE